MPDCVPTRCQGLSELSADEKNPPQQVTAAAFSLGMGLLSILGGVHSQHWGAI
jgi:hypothetical protein